MSETDGGMMVGWISVKDRLPDQIATVLVYAPSDGGIVISEGWYPKGSGQHWIGHTTQGAFHVTGVTHWMPLPEPPK